MTDGSLSVIGGIESLLISIPSITIGVSSLGDAGWKEFSVIGTSGKGLALILTSSTPNVLSSISSFICGRGFLGLVFLLIDGKLNSGKSSSVKSLETFSLLICGNEFKEGKEFNGVKNGKDLVSLLDRFISPVGDPLFLKGKSDKSLFFPLSGLLDIYFDSFKHLNFS